MSWRNSDSPRPSSLALIELSSVARGIETVDRMLKAAEVELVMARTICSGKYMVMVAGDLNNVEASVAAGRDIARECEIDHFLIADVHPDVFPAIAATTVLSTKGAIGVIESFSVASLIEAIDRVAKMADVQMAQCRLAMALGGKAYLVFTGEVAAVEYAIAAGVEVVEERGLLVNQVVIPDPRPELFETMI